MTLGHTVASLEHKRGWTPLPRTAFWLCVPALVTGGAVAASFTCRLALPAGSPAGPALAKSAAVLATSFGMPAMFLTPVGAVLILLVSIQRKWQSHVVAVLWVTVIAAMAMILPAIDAAFSDWMIIQGATTEQRR